MSENDKLPPVAEPVEPTEHHDKHEKKESKDVKKLKARIEELEAQNAKLVNDYYKAYADAENIKKRNAADLEVAKKYRIQSFAKEILQVLDNFERTLSAMEDHESPLAKGIQMTYDQLIHALNNEGVVPIEALNQPLDPNLHHAILTEVKEGVEPNIVIDVLQKGYLLKDRLLRPALVKVSE
jgi:molecular chaperone GrpE